MASEKSTGCSLRGGDEFDMLTKARRFHKRRAGDAKAAKQRFNRRVRRMNDPRKTDPLDGADHLNPVGGELR
jgi:hypothetical protein